MGEMGNEVGGRGGEGREKKRKMGKRRIRGWERKRRGG